MYVFEVDLSGRQSTKTPLSDTASEEGVGQLFTPAVRDEWKVRRDKRFGHGLRLVCLGERMDGANRGKMV